MSDVSDLSEVVNDGVLSEAFGILRSVGTFQLGGWVTTSKLIPGWGVVSVASTEDLIMIPHGDRVTGAMVFHTKARIYLTIRDSNISSNGSGSNGWGQDPWGKCTPYGGEVPSQTQGPVQRVSDIMIWNGDEWRVMKVGPYPNRTFWKAIAVRLQGE